MPRALADSDRMKWDEKYAAPGYRRGDDPPALIRGMAQHLEPHGEPVAIAALVVEA